MTIPSEMKTHPTLPSKYQEILLTGGTGVLGSRLLLELLETTNCRIHCLVRAENTEQARQRLLGLFRTYDPEQKYAEQFDSRVIPVPGEVTQDRFGLSEADY